MKTLAFGAALAALAVALPGAAEAQKKRGAEAAAPAVLIVDTNKIFEDCTACRAARTQLQSAATGLEQRQLQIRQQLSTEGQPLQSAVNALGGRAPDPALKARITAFENRQQQLAQELQGRQATLQSTEAHVTKQIGDRLIAIVEQIRATRRAEIVISKQSTLANDNAIDVTADALAQLNTQLPSVSVTPMPQTAPPAAQPQGR